MARSALSYPAPPWGFHVSRVSRLPAGAGFAGGLLSATSLDPLGLSSLIEQGLQPNHHHPRPGNRIDPIDPTLFPDIWISARSRQVEMELLGTLQFQGPSMEVCVHGGFVFGNTSATRVPVFATGRLRW